MCSEMQRVVLQDWYMYQRPLFPEGDDDTKKNESGRFRLAVCPSSFAPVCMLNSPFLMSPNMTHLVLEPYLQPN